MSEVIRETTLLAPCDTCGQIDGTKVFQLGSRVFAALCPVCAGEVVDGLRKAFTDPDQEFPAWVKAMQKI